MNGWELTGKLLVGAVFLFGAYFIALIAYVEINIPEPTKAEKAFQSYQDAVKLCGKNNLEQNDYKDGSTDFTCKDYEKIKL